MIPDLNQDGILPPFLTDTFPHDFNSLAPYSCSMIEIAERFTYSPERKRIFLGLLNFREAMRSAGLTEGFQWIDGSFVENCEFNRGNAPNDIDLVTFFEKPQDSSSDECEYWGQDIFNRKINKSKYYCDSFFVNLSAQPEWIVTLSSYWYGLFSHQRRSFSWKGLLRVSLEDESEEIARSFIEGGSSNAS